MLCITGLPLIFHHEIDQLIGYAPQSSSTTSGASRASVDQIAAAALRHDPGKVLQYLSWEKDEPGLVVTFTNRTVDGDPNQAVVKAFDAVTAEPVGLVGTGPMLIILRLHVDMFAGLPGKLFLGGMGLLMVMAIVSGVVLYWPFTRRMAFGTLRISASPRIRWLDWHNLLGVVTIVWAIVVGLTGTINTLAEPMFTLWKKTELAALIALYKDRLPLKTQSSLDVIVANARIAVPGYDVGFIAFPGTPFSSSHHFAAYMRGNTALTARLVRPVLLDGETASVAATSDLPLYLKALFLSQPLHFGDYGGMPLKIIWALLDMMTIVVLASGLYLWWVKRRRHRRGGSRSAAAPSQTVVQ